MFYRTRYAMCGYAAYFDKILLHIFHVAWFYFISSIFAWFYVKTILYGIFYL